MVLACLERGAPTKRSLVGNPQAVDRLSDLVNVTEQLDSATRTRKSAMQRRPAETSATTFATW